MERHRLIPIGQFAQASGLSLKALRLYDAVQLLRPARVDPSSGYRHYAPSQLGPAQLIRMLRQLDFSVDQIGDLMRRIEAGKDVTAALTDHIAAAEQQLSRRRAVLDQIRQRIALQGGEMNHPVRVSRLAVGSVLAQRHTVGVEDLDQVARKGFADLYAVAGRGPLTLTTKAFIRYHGRLDEDNRSEIELCLPFWNDGAAPMDLPEDVYVLDLPDVQFAYTALSGSDSTFPTALQGYDAVADWIVRHGFALEGPAYEIFRRWRGQAGHPDNILEVGWAIEAS
ncbi:MerR family transcriptional regulator [Micromonospora sp. R77]|uniref:MerR family transcriptional regulator n=1 Tax=Micromonospora sp. R77 TaxID=2925836 RepID=UPI001F61FCF8|nr:MerR family transcriptional regulator [Micromonospora sp. R77]MCI4062280.1 MerR family transcriptional regulator [Micromonospora sp. R77]